MAATKKLRDRTREVVIVSDPEDNRTGYRILVYFKSGKLLPFDQVVVESPSLFGECEKISYNVSIDYNTHLIIGYAPFANINVNLIALTLIQKHEKEIITAIQ